MKDPGCYSCVHRRDVPGSCHSSCGHPDANLLDFASLGIVARRHGVEQGWFFWPLDFDPVWLEECNGFEEKKNV